MIEEIKFTKNIQSLLVARVLYFSGILDFKGVVWL